MSDSFIMYFIVSVYCEVYILIKLWEVVFVESNVNGKFNAFMDIFGYYFDMCFPIKLVNQSSLQRKSWITQGIKKSIRRLLVEWFAEENGSHRRRTSVYT
jgi:hypothetical protein